MSVCICWEINETCEKAVQKPVWIPNNCLRNIAFLKCYFVEDRYKNQNPEFKQGM